MLQVARLKRNGKIDRGFGQRGFAATGLSDRALVTGITRAPGGKVLIGAQTKSMSRFDQYVVRLKRNGNRDAAFGNGGFLAPFGFADGVIDLGALAWSADGHLLVAGQGGTPACVGVPTPDPCEPWQMVRSFSADGERNSSFGTDGIVKLPLDGFMVSLAVASDGFVYVGSSRSGESYVSRLTATGAIDSAFADGQGFQQAPQPLDGLASSAGGGVYLGGVASGRFAVTALTPQGDLDATFASGGVFARTLGEPTLSGAGSLMRRSDGSLFLAGPVSRACGAGQPTFKARCRLSAGVVRLNSGGTPVASFGQAGMAEVPISRTPSRFDEAHGIQVIESKDGLRLATPFFGKSARDEPTATAVIALREDGRLDRDYGRNGRSLIALGA
jgi:uncharacterized delta-60 repeat protein